MVTGISCALSPLDSTGPQVYLERPQKYDTKGQSKIIWSKESLIFTFHMVSYLEDKTLPEVDGRVNWSIAASLSDVGRFLTRILLFVTAMLDFFKHC